MMKHLFYNDYSEGAHPRILQALSESNLVQEIGYGADSLTLKAIEVIKQKIGNPDVAIHFVSGGTQANQVVLASLLKPHEAVIAVNSAHIAVHEAGAIETTGHKIITAESADGKLRPQQVIDVCDTHTDEHMVKPRVVFISQATEVGTIYNKTEIEALSQICKERGLLFYVDGARLGSALTSEGCDLSLQDLSHLTDAFYIGGTKNGALLGEAIVICNKDLQTDFRYHLKQRGALLAKGRILGAQFLELFKNDLYFDLARHANAMAAKLRDGIRELGYSFQTESTTNQIFPILPNSIIEKLKPVYGFYVWQKINEEQSCVRLVTSWATTEEATERFLEELRQSK
jgi:threonine aldolase